MAVNRVKTKARGLKSSERKLKQTAEGRERKLVELVPDLDEVDEAVTAAVMKLLKTGALNLSGDLVAISTAAVAHLVDRGYSRAKSKARLIQRFNDPRRYRYRDVVAKVSVID